MSHKALMLVEARIDDPQRFGQYAARMLALLPQHGGRYLVMRGERETLEGDFGSTRVVISEWPSMAAARAFWESADYAAIRPLREGTGEFRVMLLETVDAGEQPS